MRTMLVGLAAIAIAIAGCKKEEKAQPTVDKPKHPATSADPAAKPANPAAKPGDDAKERSLASVIAALEKKKPGTESHAGFGKSLFGEAAPMMEAGLPTFKPSSGRPAQGVADTETSAPSAPSPPPVAPLPPGQTGGDCAATAKRIAAIMKALVASSIDGMEPEARKQTEAAIDQALAEATTSVRESCEQQKWPTELRDCILLATDLDSLQACHRFAPPGLEGDVDDDELPTPSGPPPKWDGASSDCAAVAKQLKAMFAWRFSADADPETKSMLAEMEGEARGACEQESWSEATRLCVLRADSLQALESCDPY